MNECENSRAEKNLVIVQTIYIRRIDKLAGGGYGATEIDEPTRLVSSSFGSPRYFN